MQYISALKVFIKFKKLHLEKKHNEVHTITFKNIAVVLLT